MVRGHLPLHICGAAAYLTALALLWRGQLVFEIALYWGAVGTFQAVLTPELDSGPASRWFWLFFIRHSGVVIGALYAWWALDLRPRRHSAWWVFLITNVYLVFVAIFNDAAGSNYMFLSKPPEAASPVVLLAWPWYILLALALLGAGFLILQWISRRWPPRSSR